MTDADIADSELRAEQNLQRFIAAMALEQAGSESPLGKPHRHKG
jgi:hypothetical protein